MHGLRQQSSLVVFPIRQAVYDKKTNKQQKYLGHTIGNFVRARTVQFLYFKLIWSSISTSSTPSKFWRLGEQTRQTFHPTGADFALGLNNLWGKWVKSHILCECVCSVVDVGMYGTSERCQAFHKKSSGSRAAPYARHSDYACSRMSVWRGLNSPHGSAAGLRTTLRLPSAPPRGLDCFCLFVSSVIHG